MYSVSPRFAFFSREGLHADEVQLTVGIEALRKLLLHADASRVDGFQAPKPILVARGRARWLSAQRHLWTTSMASWSDVGAGEGSHGHHEGDGANGYDDFGDGQDLPGGEAERGSSAGWSWTNHDDGGRDGHHERDHSVGSRDLGSTSSRRRRGKRGSGSGKPQQQRWRSGQVPVPPEFDGDVEANPFCLRHYKRALERWVRITKEFLPPNEQALRALDMMRGPAALEFEEVDDERYDKDDGIKVLLGDLERHFGEKEIYRRGGVIREYETITRVQGESITAFIRRFRLVERKLQDAQVAPYPDESRAIKFLDGLRLDEKTISHILLAAGNRYNFQAILDAVHDAVSSRFDFDWHGSTRSFAFFEFGAPTRKGPW